MVVCVLSIPHWNGRAWCIWDWVIIRVGTLTFPDFPLAVYAIARLDVLTYKDSKLSLVEDESANSTQCWVTQPKPVFLK
ncbi:hypothetical protein WA1_17430 [Scytonema hofmannii PCC 7110]|uniref:Uncharacterized protein n=1 Tax=Scytonema hofmannii PCC 7110 TaxID=128403 RepID=A0A139XAS7_9CYAN|nr:hypothetical protein [Scytonema hofmannii]KYC41807.1 hypothetical protein WA1_17430 [Scytonema hofmannii PCC 7110]